MRIRIERTILASALVILFTALLVPAPRNAHARSARPCTVSIFDDILTAEPGEDPHLKVEPQIRVEPVGGLGSGALPAADPSGRDLLGSDAPSGAMTRSSRVHSKFLAMLRFFFGTTVPR